MCSHKNRLTEAILIRTHNIPFFSIKKKITLIIPNLQPRDFFPRDSSKSSKQPW